MKTELELKEIVRTKYAEIALQDKETNMSSCCGSGVCSDEVYNIMSEDYSKLEGYVPGADLGLGCGLPTEHALIREGMTVIDLGSGAGNDCFIARKLVGESGKVIGIDFTPEMIEKARINAETLGFNNVEFRQGDIENMPVAANRADVVVSNCVLNLVPNKRHVMREIFRVLKPGAHFSISDIVLQGILPESLQQEAEMYAGCVSGAIQMDDYLELIKDAGFEEVKIQKKKEIHLPADILNKYLNTEQTESFLKGETGIFSITVFGKKPGCCEPGKNCC